MDHAPSHPRKRVRMTCAFGHLTVALGPADGYPMDKPHHGRLLGLYGHDVPREPDPVHTRRVEAAPAQPAVTVRRRSRLPAQEETT